MDPSLSLLLPPPPAVGLLARGRAGVGDAAVSGREGDGSPGATRSRRSHGGLWQRRRSKPKKLGLGVGGCGHRREEAAVGGGGVRGKVRAAEDRRRWPAFPSRGADMECGGRGHPHLIFSPISGGGAARAGRRGGRGSATGRGRRWQVASAGGCFGGGADLWCSGEAGLWRRRSWGAGAVVPSYFPPVARSDRPVGKLIGLTGDHKLVSLLQSAFSYRSTRCLLAC
jgi:hypothetical protein